MPGTVWYVSFSRKKIEFKKYPKKKKIRKKSSQKIRNFFFDLIFLLTLVFFMNSVLAGLKGVVK